MENLNVLSLNCQKGYHPEIRTFLHKVIAEEAYDFLLLQEANQKVLAMLEHRGPYRMLGPLWNKEAGALSHLCILYRDVFSLRETGFVSFSGIDRRFARRPEPGFLLGIFERGGKRVLVGSLHLRPGLSFRTRRKEMAMVQEELLRWNGVVPMIFGGDLNVAFPLEGASMRRSLAAAFSEATLPLGKTLNGRYTERGDHLVSIVNDLFKLVGIGIKFKTDRIFVDRRILGVCQVTSSVLPDRVSDHSPIAVGIHFPRNTALTAEATSCPRTAASARARTK